MGSVATPPPAPVTTTAPPASHPDAFRSTEDAMVAKFTDKLAARAAAAPATPPATQAPPVTPPSPETVQAQPQAVSPTAAEPVTEDIPLEEIDFDAPPKEAETPKEIIPDAQIESSLSEMLAKGELPEEIEKAFLKHSRGKQMLASFKTLRELAKPPEEGGIGRVPTLDEIRAAETSHQQMEAMRFEMRSDPVSFIKNLVHVDPATGTNFLGGMNEVRQFVRTLPAVIYEALQSSGGDPFYGQLVAEYSIPAFTNFFNTQYARAGQMPQSTPQEQEVKARALDALQWSEYTAFGKARPLDPYVQTNGPSQNPNAPDPEKAQLLQRVQYYENLTRQSQQTQQNQAIQRVENEGRTASMNDIDTVLKAKGIAGVYSAAVLDPVKVSIYNEIAGDPQRGQTGLIQRHNPSGYQTYELQVKAAAAGQIDPSVPAQTYRLLFQNVLKNNPSVRARFNTLVQDAKAASDARHQTLAQTQTRTEPNGSGALPPQSVLPAGQIDRQPGESREEFLTRRLAASMTNRSAQSARPV